MTIPERIHDYLVGRTAAPFCDDCLAKAAAVSQRQTVNTVTATLALTTGFEKRAGICTYCRNDKLVTRCLQHA